MATQKTTGSDVSRYVDAVQRGARWLVGHQAPDGSIERHLGIGAYYKVPWALAVTGHTAEASRLLNWIRREALGSDGDLTTYRSPGYDTCYTYPNSWVASGAWKMGYFDLASRAMDFILTYQDPKTGGFFSSKERQGKQEIWVTCGSGIAAIICGRLAEARGVADFLEVMLREQPDPERRFYNVYEPGRGLVTQFPPEQVVEYVVEVDRQEDQWDFLPGIAMAFLGRLYLATGEARLLDIAAGYVAFARRLSEDMFARWRVTKGGWGGAVMHLATGDPQYQVVARNVLEHYARRQTPEGNWSSLNGNALVNQIDATAEIVSLMDEMIHVAALVP